MRPRHRAVLAALALAAAPALAAPFVTVAQRDRSFAVRELSIAQGSVVRFTNEDDYPHQVSVRGPGISHDTDLIAAQQFAEVAFPNAGTFQVRCGVHPRMRMAVEVQ